MAICEWCRGVGAMAGAHTDAVIPCPYCGGKQADTPSPADLITRCEAHQQVEAVRREWAAAARVAKERIDRLQAEAEQARFERDEYGRNQYRQGREDALRDCSAG